MRLRNLSSVLIKNKQDTAKAHEKLPINGLGYLHTDMKAKYNRVKQCKTRMKKLKDDSQLPDLMKEHNKALMELEWKRIRKFKMSYLVYLNYQIDSHHHALTNLAKILDRLESIGEYEEAKAGA